MGATRVVSRRALLGAGAAVAMGAVLGGCGDGRGADDGGAPPSTAGPAMDGGTTTVPGPTAGGLPTAYVPGDGDDWETVAPESAGWSTDGLAALDDLVGGANSRALLVTTGGRIVLERYYGVDAGYAQDVASCQKSVMSTLIGIAVDRGLVQLDQPVSSLLPVGWSKAPPDDEARITVRHLLTMSSGLRPTTLELVAPPGTTFEYNTEAYQKLRPALEAAAGDGIDAIARSWLFDPIGIGPSAGWAPRGGGAGDAERLWGLTMTVRDMARFGLLSRHRGRWPRTGATLVDDAWYDQAWAPTPTNPAYGYLWWLAGRSDRAGRGTPSDWVAALGAGDQKIYVIPSLDLVVARLGGPAEEAADAGTAWDLVLLGAVLAART